MNLTIRYRQKLFLKIFIFAMFLIVPVMVEDSQLYFFIPYYLPLVIMEIVIHLYYASKKILITDKDLQFYVLWGLKWKSIAWASMEEASEIYRKSSSYQSGILQAMEPFAVLKWFGSNSKGITIKIIVTNEEAAYINFGNLKNSAKLYDILKEKVNFVRS